MQRIFAKFLLDPYRILIDQSGVILHTANLLCAYHLHKKILASSVSECSRSGQHSALWKLPILHAVKVFMWRACHNALSTKANLCKRCIIDDPLCPLCGAKLKTTSHILWSCPAAQTVWSTCGRTRNRVLS